MSRNLRWPTITIGVALAASSAISACSSGQSAGSSTIAVSAPADATSLAVTDSGCIGSWRDTAAGPHTFTVANRSRQPMQVSFINAQTGVIFGQVLQLDPNTSRPLPVDPPAGSYRFRCIPRRGVALVSPAHAIAGPGGTAATALTPLSAEQIVTAVSVYRHGVRRGITRLVADTDRLTGAVEHGSRRVAKRRWLVAHLDWARLGAAYGTFAAASDAIDGRADGLPGGVNDPDFKGFLAVENLLWHGASTAQVAATVHGLDDAVHHLEHRFPHLSLVAGDLPLRAHEILENALQFELTGDTDEGSHTNLATTLANVEGTQLVIRALTPALQSRRPGLLTQINAELAATAHELQSLRVGGGRWPSVMSLPRNVRAHLDASVDGVLQNLALLPGVLTLPASLALP